VYSSSCQQFIDLVGRFYSKCHWGKQIRKNEMEKTRAMYAREMPTEF